MHDPWVRRARQEGWRSRAVFKLMEIDEQDQLLRPGQIVVDLGAAPGGWSQWAARRVGDRVDGPGGRVLALDVLAMPGLPGVEFIQGDFDDDAVCAELQTRLGKARVDVVLSDMLPNLSGVTVTDQARSMALAELALDFACRHLKPEGAFLVKVFQGRDFQAFLADMRRAFVRVYTRKPKASRDRSAEVYLLGRGLSGA